MVRRLSQGKQFLRWLLPLLLFALLVGYSLWDPLTHPEKTFAGSDIKLAVIHWANFISSELRAGRLPLWNPYVHSGYPFLAHPSSALFYPTTWLYAIVPPNWALSVSIAIHLLLAAFFMEKLAFLLTKDRWGSVACAVTYAFGGYFAAKINIGHFPSTLSAALLPLVAYTAYRAVVTRRLPNFLGASAALALQIFAGFPENTVITVLFVSLLVLITAVYAGIQALNRTRRNSQRVVSTVTSPVVLLAGIVFFGGLLSAVQLLPSLEFARATTRAQGLSYSESILFSMTPEHLTNLINPVKYRNSVYLLSSFPEFLNYLGITSLSLAFVALFVHLSAPSLISLLLTLAYVAVASINQFVAVQSGNPWPYHTVFFLLCFGLVILTWIFAKPKRLSDAVPLALGVIGVLGFMLSFGAYLPFNAYRILWQTIPIFRLFRIPSHYLLLTLASVSLLSAYGVAVFRNRTLKVIVVSLVIVDFIFFFKPFVTTSERATYPTHPELVAAFTAFDRSYRLYHSWGDYASWSTLIEVFDPNAAMTYQIENLKGGEPMILKAYADLFSAIDNRPIVPYPPGLTDVTISNYRSPLLNLLSVRYFLMLPEESDLAKEDPRRFRLMTQAPRFRLFENLDALPKGSMIFHIKSVSTKSEAISAIASTDFQPGKEVIVEKQYANSFPLLSTNQHAHPATVKLLSRLPASSVFQVTTPAAGVLLVTDIYYPGWKATLDDKRRVPVVPVDFTLRGIPIPAGTHTVTMYFAPDTLTWGAFTSAAAALAMGIVWWVYGRRKNK